MSRVVITICFLLCLSATAFAQEEIDVGERIYLRELTQVSAATKIVSRPGGKLPAKNPIRIHLALGLDFETQSRFKRWLEDWNAKQGAKFGMVEIVSKAEEADVILARFIDTEFSVTMTVMVPWAKSPVSPNVQKRYAPVYSYVLRPAEGRLDVLWRNAAQIDLEKTSRYSNRAGWELRDALFSLLRKRS